MPWMVSTTIILFPLRTGVDWHGSWLSQSFVDLLHQLPPESPERPELFWRPRVVPASFSIAPSATPGRRRNEQTNRTSQECGKRGDNDIDGLAKCQERNQPYQSDEQKD